MRTLTSLAICSLILLAVMLWRSPKTGREEITAPATSSRVAQGVATSSSARQTAIPSSPPIARAQPKVSREDAKRYLDGIVSQLYPAGKTMPELNFRPEDDASPEEKEQIIIARKSAEQRGKLLLIARSPDGELHFDYTEGDPNFPREMIPPHIRASLLEEDWEVFQVDMKVASMVAHGFGRTRNKPNKAPEPTTTSVMPPADERRIK